MEEVPYGFQVDLETVGWTKENFVSLVESTGWKLGMPKMWFEAGVWSAWKLPSSLYIVKVDSLGHNLVQLRNDNWPINRRDIDDLDRMRGGPTFEKFNFVRGAP